MKLQIKINNVTEFNRVSIYLRTEGYTWQRISNVIADNKQHSPPMFLAVDIIKGVYDTSEKPFENIDTARDLDTFITKL